VTGTGTTLPFTYLLVYTEQFGKAITLKNCVRRCSVRTSAGTSAILTYVLSSFHQSCQASAGLAPPTSKRPLPLPSSPSKFIIRLHLINRLYAVWDTDTSMGVTLREWHRTIIKLNRQSRSVGKQSSPSLFGRELKIPRRKQNCQLKKCYTFWRIIWNHLSSGIGRHSRRWQDNIKTDLKETGFENMDWARLPQDTVQWLSLLKMAMNVWAL
jgi:hypothetical protein